MNPNYKQIIIIFFFFGGGGGGWRDRGVAGAWMKGIFLTKNPKLIKKNFFFWGGGGGGESK